MRIRKTEASDLMEKENRKDSNNSFSNYGNLCYSDEKYAVVKSSENSYYGQAYLLFEIKTQKLIFVFPFRSHLEIHVNVQHGDEINFLYPNSDKPLKALCYNMETGELFRKKYPSMIGRGIAYKDGKKIYFNTDKYDSYLKFYFANLPTKQRNVDWIDKDNSEHYVISKARNFLRCNGSEIITTMYRYKIFDNLVVYGDKTDDVYAVFDEFSTYTYDLGLNRIRKQLRDIVGGHYFNVVKIENEYRLYVGDSVYRCYLEDDKIKTQLLYNFKLQFNAEFVSFIEAFPWSETLEHIVGTFDLPQIISLEFLRTVTLPITQIYVLKIAPYIFYKFCDDWNDSICEYLSLIAQKYFFYKIEKPSSEELISGFKRHCTVCDNGVVYFNGEHSCYLRFENDEIDETQFALGRLNPPFRNGVHYIAGGSFYNKSRYLCLCNVYKDAAYNTSYSPRIPIYDLELFSANVDGMIGITPLCKDILEKQTQIETRFMELTEE